MKEVNSEIMIFSVFQKDLSLESNMANHKLALEFLNKYSVPYLELQGKYNGSEELSILLNDLGYRSTVEKLCAAYRQECYLEADDERNAKLVFADYTTASIGKLMCVSKDKAESKGSYSYNPVNNCYYIAE